MHWYSGPSSRSRTLKKLVRLVPKFCGHKRKYQHHGSRNGSKNKRVIVYKGRIFNLSSTIGTKYNKCDFTGHSKGYSKTLRNIFRGQECWRPIDSAPWEETFADMKKHAQILLNQPGTANSSDVNGYLFLQAEILHDLAAEPYVSKEFLTAITEMIVDKACGSDVIPLCFWYLRERKMSLSSAVAMVGGISGIRRHLIFNFN